MSELKSSVILNLIGTIDELNSHMGLVKALFADENARLIHCQYVENIQKKLMQLMAHISDITNCKLLFTKEDVTELEQETGKLTEKFPKLTGFVLPGKSILEAQIHIARTIARRAERLFFAVNEEQTLCPNAGEYLNKLSSYLFALSLGE